MGTVFLSDLARITGRTRDTVRNLQNRDGTPWDDDDFKDQKRRRYGVKHALSLVVCEMLEAQHITTRDAAEFVSGQQRAISLFIEELPAKDPTQRFVVAAFTGDEIAGRVTWTKLILAGYGTAEEVADLMAGELARVGKKSTRRQFGKEVTVRRVGGPMIAVASVPEAFRILTDRAAQAGFVLDGEGFLPVPADAGEANT